MAVLGAALMMSAAAAPRQRLGEENVLETKQLQRRKATKDLLPQGRRAIAP